MKLDINAAWSDALNLIQSNMAIVSTMAGVFFFLPTVALNILAPQIANPTVDFEPEPDNPMAALEQLNEVFAESWWVIILLMVLQTIGTLALLAMLRAKNRPTVGEAIGIGAIGLLTYLAANIGLYFILAVVAGLLIGGAAVTEIVALVVILSLLTVVGFIYVAIKVSLLAPVIAIDKIYNPISALARSWKLTKGNSLRLLAFYILLVIAFLVVSVVITIFVGLVFGLAGGQAALIGNGIASAIISAASVVLFLGIAAGIHRQLSGLDETEVSESFE